MSKTLLWEAVSTLCDIYHTAESRAMISCHDSFCVGFFLLNGKKDKKAKKKKRKAIDAANGNEKRSKSV